MIIAIKNWAMGICIIIRSSKSFDLTVVNLIIITSFYSGLPFQEVDPENATKIDAFIQKVKKLKELESPFTLVDSKLLDI